MNRIFLLDDHQMVREGLRDILLLAGHSVVGETGSLLGLTAKLKKTGAEILVLDIHLQGTSGLSILQSLETECPNVRTVVLTMSSQQSHVSDALRLGALSYVLKDSPSSELLNAIEAAAYGRKYLGKPLRKVISDLNANDCEGGPLAKLSNRERQILGMVVRGKTSALISVLLSISPKTVETYRHRLMTKREISDLPSLVRSSIQWGLLDANDQR